MRLLFPTGVYTENKPERLENVIKTLKIKACTTHN